MPDLQVYHTNQGCIKFSSVTLLWSKPYNLIFMLLFPWQKSRKSATCNLHALSVVYYTFHWKRRSHNTSTTRHDLGMKITLYVNMYERP